MNYEEGSDVLIENVDGIGFDDWRAWVTARARGSVLEIGAGTGENFSYYQENARVVAFDPDPEQLDEVDSSEARAHHVRLAQASAEDMPFPDAAFDAAVGTLVFCTIPDAARALAEVKRVLKPGAPLRLVEHVRFKNPVAGALQGAVTPLWKYLAGGCHLNRNTLNTVRGAGFDILSVHERWWGMLIGIDARK